MLKENAHKVYLTFLLWMDMPTYRAERQFLEEHRELLDPKFDTVLEQGISRDSAMPEYQQDRFNQLAFLRAIYGRGGTVTSIREAYIDTYEILGLDVPDFIDQIVVHLTSLREVDQHYQTTIQQQVVLLRMALKYAIEAPSTVSNELIAILQNELGQLLLADPRASYTHIADEVVGLHTSALKIFRYDHYPRQYVWTQILLGSAYVNKMTGDRSIHIEYALAASGEALRLATYDTPEMWAMAQSVLGVAYAERVIGDKRDNLEQAIIHHNAALQIHNEYFPELYAQAQHNLGVAYANRMAGIRRDNLELAIECYHKALHIRTIDAMPTYWAATQNSLGNAYRVRIAGTQRDNYERAIVCFEAALQIYTEDTFPEDYTMVIVNLGRAYMERIGGPQRNNIEQAVDYYNRALRIYERDSFPSQWADILNCLGTAHAARVEGSRRNNIEKAIDYHNGALQVYLQTTFPLEWADTQMRLGDAYYQRLVGWQCDNIEQAINYYKKALQFFTFEAFPEDWALVHINLGSAFRLRLVGIQRDNVKQTMKCYEAALKVYTRNNYPQRWAMIQCNIADTFARYLHEKKRINIGYAIDCYMAALEVYTRDDFPHEWANIQIALGHIFVERSDGNRHTNIQQAIEYFLGALLVYTRNSFPSKWAAIQNGLGNAYMHRIAEEQRINLEKAIQFYQGALQVYTFEDFPTEVAMVFHNLGDAYVKRIVGEITVNIEFAIRQYHNPALRIYTRDTHPLEYASLQRSLGHAYSKRIAGDKSENMDLAITYYSAALDIYTYDAFPEEWAITQNNMAGVYRNHIKGTKQNNLETALTYYSASLRIFTSLDFPYNHADVQYNLGETYYIRIEGDRQSNLKYAIACYREALKEYKLDTFPSEYRRVQMHLAEAEIERGNWSAAHEAYTASSAAEERLFLTGAGVTGRDILLYEGNETTIRHGFVLVRMGQVDAAARIIEYGRARGLSQARRIEDLNFELIRDPEQREAYKEASANFHSAYASLNKPVPHMLNEGDRQHYLLTRDEVYRKVSKTLYRLILEIDKAGDPAVHILLQPRTATIIRYATEIGGPGHALVYLGATPWGGIVIAVLNTSSLRSIAFDLPTLTDEFMNDLIDTHFGDEAGPIIGGFAHAQNNNGYTLIQNYWPGDTFRAKAEALHTYCDKQGKLSTLDTAAQATLTNPQLVTKIDQPLAGLTDNSLVSILNRRFREHELLRCFDMLSESVMQPLIARLHEEGVTSVTLIPCGPLSAFPLTSISLAEGRLINDGLSMSIAPNALSLLTTEPDEGERSGVYTIGDPNLEDKFQLACRAEAEVLAAFAQELGKVGSAKVQKEATKDNLIKAMQKGYVVDAACHGIFDNDNFLKSALLLADDQRLLLGELLSQEVDIRGLRLLILSACQTAVISLKSASNEVNSLAVGMLQAGAKAVLATLWPVDEAATYLLMVRFAYEWFPVINEVAPAVALRKAQRWLQTVKNHELQSWSTLHFLPFEKREDQHKTITRMDSIIQNLAKKWNSEDCHYSHPVYWAGFQIYGR